MLEKPTSVSILKNTLLYAFIITLLSLAVVLISVAGGWVISNVSVVWAWIASFAVGSLIFIIWKGVLIKLKITESLKSEFITIAAHKIRTPLTRVRWMISEIVSKSGLGESDQSVVSIGEILDDLTQSSNNLLTAAEAGKPSLYYDYVFESGRFENTVRQIVAEYSVGAKAKNISVATDIVENLPEISFDKDRMKTAVGVFIENSIIYTPKGGSMEISVFTQKNKLYFSIKDSGIGISKESIPYIFSKFFRTKEAVSLDRDRAGLGLFIAKEIIEKHGGGVSVSSKGKDHGSHFQFFIPIR